MKRIVFFVPSDKPVGGIAKVLDYAVHASMGGYDSIFCCKNINQDFASNPLFLKPYFKKNGGSIKIISINQLEPLKSDIVFFTLPSNHSILSRIYFKKLEPCERFIHLLQNTRVAGLQFDRGYSFRLLSKKLHRICITNEVLKSVEDYVLDKEILKLIPHGFDFDVFDKLPKKNDKVCILVNLFKGEFGLEVINYFKKDKRIKKINICKKGISWENLIKKYRESSIFVSTPLPEEGLYLPGLEAMAAGNLVITPDCYGNRFYCDFSKNSIKVNYQVLSEYIKAIDESINNWQGSSYIKRLEGYKKASELKLDNERELFIKYLNNWF